MLLSHKAEFDRLLFPSSPQKKKIVELKPDTYIHKADSAQMWHLASIILAKKDPSNKVYLTCRNILESKSNIFRY